MATINRQDYLKKYLSKSKPKSKEKKKKTSSQPKRFNIIEDSLDLKAIPFGFVEEDCAPTVAEITYDDDKTKFKDEFQFNKRKWKVLNQDEINENSTDIKYQHNLSANENEAGDSFSRLHENDSPIHNRYDSEASPPRNKRHHSSSLSFMQKRKDSDTLLVGRERRDSNSPAPRKRHDSDASPVRRKRHDSDDSAVRRKKHDLDTSAVRRNRHDSDTSPVRRNRHDSDASPVRRKRHDSDTSPVRRKRHDSDTSPVRRKRHDSDTSPVRRKRHDSDTSPVRRKRHDSDTSPVRRKRHDSDTSPVRRKRHDSDTSPVRRKRHDSDSSPVRRKTNDKDPLRIRRNGGVSFENKTSDELSEQNKYSLSSFSKKKGGEHTKAKSFRKLHDKKKRELTDEEKVLAKQMEEKYQKWNKGVAQVQKHKEDLEYTVHEMGKSFARSADDEDMNDRLKNSWRQEDPLLEYVMKKKSEGSNRPIKPIYQGSFPPNRFHIRPGYRWDGVDRSSGYEKEWFTRQSSKSAAESESYKWSTEDM